MCGCSSLSSMLALLSRLEMYSSFSFTTYTHTHTRCINLSRDGLLIRAAHAWTACLCKVRALNPRKKGLAASGCGVNTFSSTLFLLSRRAFSCDTSESLALSSATCRDDPCVSA